MIQAISPTDNLVFNGLYLKKKNLLPENKQFIQPIKDNVVLPLKEKVVLPLKEDISQKLTKEKLQVCGKKCFQKLKKTCANIKEFLKDDILTEEEKEAEKISDANATLAVLLALLVAEIIFIFGPCLQLYLKIKSLK